MNTALKQHDAGMAHDPFMKDQALSALVMRSTPPPMEDISDRILVHGDEHDSPFQFGRKLRSKRRQQQGRDMAIHI